MSVKKRKIAYYNICYTKRENCEIQVQPFFDKVRFTEFVDYLQLLDETNLLKDKKTQNKAISIEILDYLDQDKNTIKLVMKSCKYNHSPNYMSSTDGSERTSDKRLDEGEKELTHICGQINEDEVFVVMEERRTAIGIGVVIEYLNGLYKKYLAAHNLPYDHKIIFGSIPEEGFLETLDKFERITCADVIMDKEIIGSEGIGLLEESSDLIREEINVVVKAKPKESLHQRFIKGVYESFTSRESHIRRIRVYGKDNNRSDIQIDTKFCKKVKYIEVNLNENGIVSSDEIVEKLSELLD